jgi:hypothetical protein
MFDVSPPKPRTKVSGASERTALNSTIASPDRDDGGGFARAFLLRHCAPADARSSRQRAERRGIRGGAERTCSTVDPG